jgi:hypothetical protein
MKKLLFIIYVTVYSVSFGQGYSNYTLDYFFSSTDGMKFNLKIEESDSVVITKGFDYNSFKPIRIDQKDGVYKTYYRQNKIELVEFFSNNSSKIAVYKCLVNDFDSIKYFVFLLPFNKDTSIINHSVGVNLKDENLSLVLATHRWQNADTIIKHKSYFAINYPSLEQSEKETKFEFDTNYRISWISDSYFIGRSVIIIDSNLNPLNRLYFFNGNILLYFTKCELYRDTCAEYIFSYNPILQSSGFKYLLNTIDIKFLKRVEKIDMISTFIIKSFYPIEDYYFKWEYYKYFIGKNWTEYK